MPRLAAAATTLALGAALAVALSACGGSDAKLLPGNTAQEITEDLDSVQALVEEGECVGAEDEALRVSEQVDGIKGIDPKLKQALEEGAAQLSQVVATCEEAPEETVEETVPPPASPEQKKGEEEREKALKEAEKEQEKEEKEQEKAAKEQEKEEQKEEGEGGPALPPQANGEAKGHQEPPPPAEGGAPAGGVGPAGGTEGGD
jgi:outer membrane biosynthesis protein TonB